MGAPASVDGEVELLAELDRQAIEHPIAQTAPRSRELYRYLSEGMKSQQASEAFTGFTLNLIERLSIWWAPEFYSTLPIIVPWCVRDRSCRYDQGPESWGSPRSDGYLRDDNSIIKKLPLPLRIDAPADSAYRGRKPLRGFTACHIWRDLPGGELAGADPWLYSFIPNLVWLPSWLAPLTDQQGSEVQKVLQRTSLALFGEIRVNEYLQPYAEFAWSKLPLPLNGPALPLHRLAVFQSARSFFTRRLRYLDKFVEGCDEILAGRPLTKKLICTRYTEGLSELASDDIQRFRDCIERYRTACSAGLASHAG